MIMVSLSAIAALLAAIGCAAGGWQAPTSTWMWVLLIGTGVAGYATQISITLGLKVTESVAPAVAMSYLAVLWSVVIGVLGFHEVPSVATITGALFIFVGSLSLALYEHRKFRSKHSEIVAGVTCSQLSRTFLTAT